MKSLSLPPASFMLVTSLRSRSCRAYLVFSNRRHTLKSLGASGWLSKNGPLPLLRGARRITKLDGGVFEALRRLQNSRMDSALAGLVGTQRTDMEDGRTTPRPFESLFNSIARAATFSLKKHARRFDAQDAAWLAMTFATQPRTRYLDDFFLALSYAVSVSSRKLLRRSWQSCVGVSIYARHGRRRLPAKAQSIRF